MSLNKVMLIGNVGKDPEIRYVENASGATKVASLTLATTERYKDRNGESKENTEWHNLVAWRGTADIIEKYVKKGSQIYVEGRLRTRSWSDANGVKKYTTEILVDTLQLLGKKSDNPAPFAATTAATAAATASTAAPAANPYAAAPAPVATPVAAPVAAPALAASEDEGDDLPF